MFTYIIIFGICTILAYITSRLDSKKIRISLVIAIILILSLLGGLRTTDIGYDIKIYGIRMFEQACSFKNFHEYIEFNKNLSLQSDIGYTFLNFIVSRFTNNINVFLFVIQLIPNTLVIITLYRYRKQTPFWLSLLCFLTVFYLRSYNFLRQAIALAIVFHSLYYIENKKIIPFIISIVFATTFHYTALITIVLYPLNYFLEKNKRIYNYLIILSIFILMLTIFNLIDIISILRNLGLVNEKIYVYTSEKFDGKFDIGMLLESVFRLWFISFYAYAFDKMNSKHKLNKLLFVFSIIDLILFQFRGIVMFSDRIGLYFGYFITLLIPQLPDNIAFTYKNRVVLKSVFAMIFILFYLYKFVYAGSCEVFPYVSILSEGGIS